MHLERVEVQRVAAALEGGGAAIFLGNEKKTFIIYVGIYEATAILKEIQGKESPRPLTHDLIHNIFVGFDLEVRRVVISSLVDNTFCATLVLEQQLGGDDASWAGKRSEVRIDARASDSIVIALKEDAPIWVAAEVFEAVEDVSDKLKPPPDVPGAGDDDSGDDPGADSDDYGY